LSYLQMLGSFRPPKQKLNYVTLAQLLPSAPNLANTMLVAVVFVVGCRVE
jgi:hypothetical protein